ncbi:hypothetical protein KIH74_00010 [Kineosporia sp. J2-2]|uniref:Uncharacterized protein n=1 Tax=Kineosporia corallincola TaxID=2835133 RepID=A0ABS5T878_9ACTN|nr:hypothetical protein [Kineosporia corallincola]MBT0767287.1 hypothetical protein [Kineosporia corallincola]
MIRRVLVTGTVTLATLLGPAAGIALAAPRAVSAANGGTASAPQLSAASVRPGLAFTVTPPEGCPASGEEQGVFITFTDSEDTTHQLAILTTDEHGTWGPATVRLPVVGLDDSGSWDAAEVAEGKGSLDVLCVSSDYVMAGARPGFSSMNQNQNQGQGQAVIDPPPHALENDPENDPDDDSGDDDSGDSVTLTYASAALTVTGDAAQVSVTPGIARPGGRVTVAPVDICGAGSSTARLQVIPVTAGDDSGDDDGDDDGDDPGDDSDGSGDSDDSGDGDDGDEDETDVSGLGAEADPDSVVTTEVKISGSAWPATQLTVPDDAEPGDYAVTVDCLDSLQDITSRYQAVPFAVGTVVAAAPVCGTAGASVRVTGTYPETLVTADGDELSLPATLKFVGAGPWTFFLDSALTDGLLLKQQVTCPVPDYELTVPKASVSSSGAVQARICNTGEADARALLQVRTKKGKWITVDRKLLDDGDCAWLDGGTVKKGGSARGRVLIDPPGKGSTDLAVEKTFTVRRKG